MTRQYSIKDLERLSGIKAHTIRMWEKRYGLLEPLRTDTNIRLYDDEQLKKLLDVTLLQRRGLKISHISRLTREDLRAEVASLLNDSYHVDADHEPQVHHLVKAMVDLDERNFEKIFSTAVLKQGLESTMRSVVFPFLYRIGVLWNLGEVNPGQEHFVSNLIKQKLYSAIDGTVAPETRNKVFLLYLMENELHEISLLFAAYLLRQRGHGVIYLGQSVPFESLRQVMQSRHVTDLMTILTTRKPIEEVQLHIDKMSGILEHRKLYVWASDDIKPALRVYKQMDFIDSFDKFFEKLG